MGAGVCRGLGAQSGTPHLTPGCPQAHPPRPLSQSLSPCRPCFSGGLRGGLRGVCGGLQGRLPLGLSFPPPPRTEVSCYRLATRLHSRFEIWRWLSFLPPPGPCISCPHKNPSALTPIRACEEGSLSFPGASRGPRHSAPGTGPTRTPSAPPCLGRERRRPVPAGPVAAVLGKGQGRHPVGRQGGRWLAPQALAERPWGRRASQCGSCCFRPLPPQEVQGRGGLAKGNTQR